MFRLKQRRKESPTLAREVIKLSSLVSNINIAQMHLQEEQVGTRRRAEEGIRGLSNELAEMRERILAIAKRINALDGAVFGSSRPDRDVNKKIDALCQHLGVQLYMTPPRGPQYEVIPRVTWPTPGQAAERASREAPRPKSRKKRPARKASGKKK